MAGYIRTPEENLSRNVQTLRSAIDQLVRSYNQLSNESLKISQMGTDAEVATEYGYTDVQDATDMRSLVASSVGELDAAPFFQQLISRLG